MSLAIMPSCALPICLLALAVAARAEERSFGCGKVSNAIENLICADTQLSALDRESSRLFKLAHDGKYGRKRRAELVSNDKKWRAERNKCHPTESAACLRASYAKHIAGLRQNFSDTRSEDNLGISEGSLAIRCENFDALFGVTFVRSDPPLAWLEWLGQGVAVTLVPSGSGAKYEGKSEKGTLTLWTQGEAAMIDMPNGKSLTCKLEIIG